MRRNVEAAGGAPSARDRIVDLGRFRARGRVAAGDQHLAIGQQSRGMISAARGEVASRGPDAAVRVINFRAADRSSRGSGPARHEDAAIRQESRGVQETRLRHGARLFPSAGRGIVEFRAGQLATEIVATAGHEDLPVRQQRRRVILAPDSRLSAGVQAEVAGS